MALGGKKRPSCRVGLPFEDEMEAVPLALRGKEDRALVVVLRLFVS
jgi:hypothetical protein